VRVVVTGGREYRDSSTVDRTLDEIHAATPISVLAHGDCRGADRLAADWARRRHVRLSPHPAAWDNIDIGGAKIRWRAGRPYNAAAGFQRNIRMLEAERPDLVVAFPGGTGTDHCVRNARRRKIKVLPVCP